MNVVKFVFVEYAGEAAPSEALCEYIYIKNDEFLMHAVAFDFFFLLNSLKPHYFPR